MPKKAVFIGPAHPYRGGIAAFNENLASIFQSNGWQCKIFTFIQQYPNILFPGKDQLVKDNNKPDLSIERAIYSTNPLNWLKISKQIIKEKPDVVITQYWMPFMAPAFGTILRGIKKSLKETKCITVVHNFKPHESRIGDKQLNKFIANRTDIMLTLSPSVAKDIEESIPDKRVLNLFHPIYHHYGDAISRESAVQKLNLDPNFKYLLFFGLVRNYKGLDILLNALPHVSKKHNYKLIVAGEFYEDENKYNALIKEKDLEDRVIIRNEYIPNIEIPAYFGACDVVVLPYRTATQSGVVPVAIHFKRPVIVTNVGSLSEMIESYEIGYIAQSNPEDIADHINKYFESGHELDLNFSDIEQALSWQSFYEKFAEELDQEV